MFSPGPIPELHLANIRVQFSAALRQSTRAKPVEAGNHIEHKRVFCHAHKLRPLFDFDNEAISCPFSDVSHRWRTSITSLITLLALIPTFNKFIALLSAKWLHIDS